MSKLVVCSMAALAALSSTLGLAGPARAQAPAAEAPAAEAKPAGGKKSKGPDMAAMMAAMQRHGAVGEPHKQLLKRVGTWTVTTKAFMAPDAPPVESTGTVEAKAILGDRFVQGTFTGQMMGQPFTGISTFGYDNTKKKFVGTWLDSMSTGIMVSEGTADASGKKLTLMAVSTDPMTGKEHRMRMVHTWESDTKIVEEMFEKRGGKEVKWMEITYVKK